MVREIIGDIFPIHSSKVFSIPAAIVFTQPLIILRESYERSRNESSYS